MNFPTEAPFFSLNGLKKNALVTKVYDGDTFTCMFQFHEQYWSWRCRIKDINAPELRKNDPMSYASRDFLKQCILGKECTLSIHNFDCFGRLIVDVQTETIKDVGKHIILQGHAKPFIKVFK